MHARTRTCLKPADSWLDSAANLGLKLDADAATLAPIALRGGGWRSGGRVDVLFLSGNTGADRTMRGGEGGAGAVGIVFLPGNTKPDKVVCRCHVALK